MNKKKKVLFVILEGDSDELFFFDALERYATNKQILIKVYDGDIFTDPKQERVEIRERIRNFFISRLGELKLQDILGIIHISDTDGSYVSHDKVIVDEEKTDELKYATDGIYVKDQAEKEKKEYRNEIKKQNTLLAARLNQIQYKGVKIPYQLFYLSQNLEHVVFDRLNVPSKEKKKIMVRYLKKVQGTTEIVELLNSLLPVVNGDGNNKYKGSWEFIMEEDRSLQRYANAVLMYKFIEELAE